MRALSCIIPLSVLIGFIGLMLLTRWSYQSWDNYVIAQTLSLCFIIALFALGAVMTFVYHLHDCYCRWLHRRRK